MVIIGPSSTGYGQTVSSGRNYGRTARDMTSVEIRRTLLEDAILTVNGSREEDYGSPEDSHSRIAQLWSVYLRGVQGEVTAYDVANMMILLKVARNMGSNPRRDNLVDICGYAACAEQLRTQPTAPQQGADDSDKCKCSTQPRSSLTEA